MKAVTYHRYGSPDVLDQGEVDQPVAGDGELLVRVRAVAVNPLDWHAVTGTPYFARLQSGLRRPKSQRLGVDFAGTVEAVGAGVTGFQPGDDVFGARDGAFAEYVCVRADRAVAPKPARLTFEQAAAVPIAALTALQGLRDKGRLQPGQQVLINGASGGVGTFAVQIAKALGAEVTGVCSTRNVDLVRSIGADRVIDYTREDLTRSDQRCDLLLDIAGSRSWSDCRRVLKPRATVVIAGGPKTNRLIGPLGQVVRQLLAGMLSSQRVTFFIATPNRADLVALQELLESGKVTPVIDRSYKLSEATEALRYMGDGHARGKVVLTV